MSSTSAPTVLVVLDRLGAELRSTDQQLLTLGHTLTGAPASVHVLTAADADTARSALDGLDLGSVFCADSNSSTTDALSPEHLTDLITQAARSSHATVVLASDSGEVSDSLARAAVRLEAGLITQAVGVEHDGSAVIVQKSVLAGAYTTRCATGSEASGAADAAGVPVCITVKPNVVVVPESGLPTGTTPEPQPLETSSAPLVTVVERSPVESTGRPALTEASVVVAGGRGVNGDFGLVEQLADVLGGAVGASRAAVDAGWTDHTAQVGQTGATVSPQLYVALGISGALQHRAGMQSAQTIIAINKDPDAPIFEIADLGIIGNVASVVPDLAQRCKMARQ